MPPTIFDVRLYTTSAFDCPGFTACHRRRCRHQDLGDLRRLHLRFHRPVRASRSAAATPTTSARRRCSAQNLIFGGSPDSAVVALASASRTRRPQPPDFDGKRKDTAFTPRASVSFKPNDDHNIYLSYVEGLQRRRLRPARPDDSAPDINGDGIRRCRRRSSTSWRSTPKR